MSEDFPELEQEIPQIKVTCTSTDCGNDKHCYLQKKKVDGEPAFGPCRECRCEPDFDIERIRRRKVDDVDYTFEALRNEKIRQHYWDKPFDEAAVRRAKRKGRQGIREAIPGRLQTAIGRKADGFDSRQTSLEGNVIHYAQHATATCCRKCLSYWHGVPTDRDLKPAEKKYCETLVATYLDRRLLALNLDD